MEQRALIIIDLQKGLTNDTHKLVHLSDVLEIVNQRIHAYREQKQPIIFIQHEDETDLIYRSDSWQLFDALDTKDTDYFIRKTHANSFYHTKLQGLLASLAITELEFCGAQTEYCVDTTIRMAHGLGYSGFMKKGSTTTLDNSLLKADTIIRHHEAIWENRFLTFL